MGCVYKLLSKLLANCLKHLLPCSINSNQGAFVGNNPILVGILIANELFDSIKRMWKEGVVFKLDLERAYDHVDWNLVDYMLHRFGFGSC